MEFFPQPFRVPDQTVHRLAVAVAVDPDPARPTGYGTGSRGQLAQGLRFRHTDESVFHRLKHLGGFPLNPFGLGDILPVRAGELSSLADRFGIVFIVVDRFPNFLGNLCHPFLSAPELFAGLPLPLLSIQIRHGRQDGR